MSLKDKLLESYEDGFREYYAEINTALSKRKDLYSFLMAGLDIDSWNDSIRFANSRNPHVGEAVQLAKRIVTGKAGSLQNKAAKLDPLIIDLAMMYPLQEWRSTSKLQSTSKLRSASSEKMEGCAVLIPFSANDQSNPRTLQYELSRHIKDSLEACHISYQSGDIFGFSACILKPFDYSTLENKITNLPYGLWQVKIGMRLVKVGMPPSSPLP